MKTSIRIHIVALLVALAMPISASAWMKSICSGNGEELDWDNETTQIRFSSVSFPVGLPVCVRIQVVVVYVLPLVSLDVTS